MYPILLCQINFVGTSILLDLLQMLWSEIFIWYQYSWITCYCILLDSLEVNREELVGLSVDWVNISFTNRHTPTARDGHFS